MLIWKNSNNFQIFINLYIVYLSKKKSNNVIKFGIKQ